MIQKCKITYHNKFLNIVVFEFNGKEIQMTLNIPDGTKVVYIKHENGKYVVVSEQEYKRFITPVKKEKDTVKYRVTDKK